MWNNSDKNANNKKIIEAYRYLFVWIGFAREKGTWIEIFQGSWGIQGQEIIIVSEVNQTKTNIICHLYEGSISDTDKFIYKTEIDS